MKKQKFVFEWSKTPFSLRPCYSIAANTFEEALQKIAECKGITVPVARRNLSSLHLSIYDLQTESKSKVS